MTVYVTHSGDTWQDIIKNHYGMELNELWASMTDDEVYRFRKIIATANCIYEGITEFPAGIKIKLPSIPEIKAV